MMRRLLPSVLFKVAMLCALALNLGSAACQRTQEVAPGGVEGDSAADLEDPPGVEASVGTSATVHSTAASQAAAGEDEASPTIAHAEPKVEAAKAACVSVPAQLPLAERCSKAGAEVHTFRNSCAGRCDALEKGMLCGQAMTDGCKCPKGQCIDNESGCCRAIRR